MPTISSDRWGMSVSPRDWTLMNAQCIDIPMGSRKKVVIFGSYAPSLINFRGPLIASIVARGHEVLAVAPQMDSATAEALSELGAQPHGFQLANQSINPGPMLRAFLKFRQFLRTHRPDVLITYTIHPVIVGALAGAAEGVPKIISLITGAGYAFGDAPEARRMITRAGAILLYKAALPRSAWVVFQNPDDAALFRELRMIKSEQNVCIVNGSGVDLAHFAVAPLPDAPSFLMVARLLKGKGVHEFAAAAKRLKLEHPHVGVHLVGFIDSAPDAISEAELARIIDGGVEFHGRLDDVRPALADSSIFVLPSWHREGTPRSVLEAMSMGRAIITTDAPGCRETVRNEVNGLLIPPRDADALYEAMLRFVKDPELAARMGRESRIMAECKYDVNRVNAEFIRIAQL